ncbi:MULTISPECIES: PIN domain-containing protein [Metallosphaera]|uniref:PIN domain-containing protein n=1 Tax=Metallosphaera TaxID=41980 RepID=UPI0031830359
MLPILGVEVRRTRKLLERISSPEIFYSELSLLESLWVLKKLSRTGMKVNPRRVREGLISLRSFRRARTPLSAFHKAWKSRDRHNDAIDLVLYYTALSLGMKFLTLDLELEKLDDKNVIIHNLPS